jgi:hypothetical protein
MDEGKINSATLVYISHIPLDDILETDYMDTWF